MVNTPLNSSESMTSKYRLSRAADSSSSLSAMSTFPPLALMLTIALPTIGQILGSLDEMGGPPNFSGHFVLRLVVTVVEGTAV